MSTSIVPTPKVPVAVRVATMADVPFMDALQKQHGRALGYFPLKQFEGYVNGGHVLVAEEVGSQKSEVGEDGGGGDSPRLASDLRPLPPAAPAPAPLGYIISKDRYLKRDELGVIFQLCVAPGARRKFVGAALVREAFGRSAYGCRLYCLWCAQDLEANRFWEGLGFVPVAFRAGSDRRRRVHIFWQKRIVEGDAETKWWYPFQTGGGAIRADRLVFPIPPGTHWSEVRAPEVQAFEVSAVEVPPRDAGLQPVPKALPGAKHGLKTRVPKEAKPAARPGPGPGKVGILVGGRIKYVDKPGSAPAAPAPAAALAVPQGDAPEKPKRERKARAAAAKIDPKYLAAARELRDRYLEHVNRAGGAGLLAGAGKYDVTRALAHVDGARPLPARAASLASPGRGPRQLPRPRSAA